MSEADPYPGPNEEVLEAQARVCTGPHQSRPLGKKEGDPDPKRILELIFASLRGALPRAEQVSLAQMGAFFAAMSIRRTFGAQTGWSAAEVEAFDRCGDELRKMPEDLRFLLGMAPDFSVAMRAKRGWLKRCARFCRAGTCATRKCAVRSGPC